MDTPLQAHIIYALAWLSFGAVHSVLAGGASKHRLEPMLGVYYRLSYNLFATIHIGLVMVLGGAVMSTQPYALEPGVGAGLNGVRVLGVGVLLMALREYDLGRFSGLSQIKAHRRGAPEPGDEPLIIHGMHQFVRHPLYLGAYLIFWGGAGDDFGLATAIWGSLYLWIGARHEERSLLALYGQAYAAYQTQVPAIVPWKRRAPN
ncbi:MAG TPA: isoprenylcysteine carboxylmethyltransferase family protein [Rhodospirillales bacterium]|nr:isoprenylcysteine carboxylmethyltransferase family protein [Rhodospirillales bacterium]